MHSRASVFLRSSRRGYPRISRSRSRTSSSPGYSDLLRNLDPSNGIRRGARTNLLIIDHASGNNSFSPLSGARRGARILRGAVFYLPNGFGSILLKMINTKKNDKAPGDRIGNARYILYTTRGGRASTWANAARARAFRRRRKFAQ